MSGYDALYTTAGYKRLRTLMILLFVALVAAATVVTVTRADDVAVRNAAAMPRPDTPLFTALPAEVGTFVHQSMQSAAVVSNRLLMGLAAIVFVPLYLLGAALLGVWTARRLTVIGWHLRIALDGVAQRRAERVLRKRVHRMGEAQAQADARAHVARQVKAIEAHLALIAAYGRTYAALTEVEARLRCSSGIDKELGALRDLQRDAALRSTFARMAPQIASTHRFLLDAGVPASDPSLVTLEALARR